MAKRLLLLGALLVGVTGWLIMTSGQDIQASARGSVGAGVADTTVLLSGRFAPPTLAASASILRLADDRLLLRISGARPSQRLRVYLLGGVSGRSRAELERVGFIDLGELRSGVFAVPANTPMSRVRAVALWDEQAGRSVAVAELRAR